MGWGRWVSAQVSLCTNNSPFIQRPRGHAHPESVCFCFTRPPCQAGWADLVSLLSLASCTLAHSLARCSLILLPSSRGAQKGVRYKTRITPTIHSDLFLPFITTSNHSHQAHQGPLGYALLHCNQIVTTTARLLQPRSHNPLSVLSLHFIISDYKTQAGATHPIPRARGSSPSAGWSSSALPAWRARCRASRCR